MGSLDDEFQDLQLSALLTGIGREAEWLDFPLTTFTAFHRAGWEKCRLRTSRPSAFFADDAFKAGKGGEGGSWPTLARPESGPVCKQPAMQGRQTRTADYFPHPGRTPVPAGLWRRVRAAQFQQRWLYAILVRYQQNDGEPGIAKGKG